MVGRATVRPDGMLRTVSDEHFGDEEQGEGSGAFVRARAGRSLPTNWRDRARVHSRPHHVIAASVASR
jgi:hypothetical protein